MPAFSPRGYKNPATTGEINDPAFWKTVGENQDARFVELDANLTGASADAAQALQTANSYAGQIAQANTTAGEAKGIAEGAESVVRDELQPQVDALNTAAGYAPGDATDAAMANVGSNPDTQFRAVLNAQTAERVKVIPAEWAPSLDSHQVVTLGDSIENLNSFYTATAHTNGKDWPTYAHLYSSGRFVLVRNSGIGGQNTGEYLARFDTDVTPYAPSMVVIGAAENDIQQSVPLATYQDNVGQMVAKTHAIGALPVLRTTLPHFLNATVRATIREWNEWLRDYAKGQRIPLLDFWSQMVDPATGEIVAALTNDGVHPNELAARQLGKHTVDTLWPGISAAAMPLPLDVEAATNLLPNPGWATDTAGTPTSWNAINGNPAGVTRYMTRDHMVQGRMAGIRAVASTATATIGSVSSAIDTADASPGERLEISGLLTSDGGILATVTMAVTSTSGTMNYSPITNLKARILRGTYTYQVTVPAGFTNAVVQLTAGAGTGYVEFGCPVVRNLTRLGLA